MVYVQTVLPEEHVILQKIFVTLYNSQNTITFSILQIELFCHIYKKSRYNSEIYKDGIIKTKLYFIISKCKKLLKIL